MTRGCEIEGCEKAAQYGYKVAWCAMHRQRIASHGSPDDPRKPRAERLRVGPGYWAVLMPDHPLVMKTMGYVLEHRLNLWNAIGPGSHPCHWCATPVAWEDPFPKGLVVDHLDETRDNNQLSNLVPSCAACNVARGFRARTHCGNGHELTDENTHVLITGNVTRRRCRMCARDRTRRSRERKALQLQ